MCAAKFFWFLLFLLLTLDYFTHVGIMSVNVSSNLQIATTVLTTLIPTWNVLSGFYIPKPVSLRVCMLFSVCHIPLLMSIVNVCMLS